MLSFDLAPILQLLPLSMRQPQEFKTLTGGQSLVQLFELQYAWGKAILKGPLQAREALFYQEVAPQWKTIGISLPDVYALIEHENGQWLLREAFPQVLPITRWFADVPILATLRHIHSLPTSFIIPTPFILAWQVLDEEYLGDLSASTQTKLMTLATRHQTLFTPTGVIAGDPNVSNWGVRADGTAVLFDWDSIGYGIPARDVAVVIPQLGWPTLYEQVARAYLNISPSSSQERDVAQLTHDVAMAKVQVIIEYINNPKIVADNRHFALGLLPSWCEMVWQMDETYHAQYG